MILMFSFLFLVLVVFIHDVFISKKRTIVRNFPVIGHLRYLIERVGPELRQYLVASDREELPFNRRDRSYIYASAKGQSRMIGFGSDADFSKPGHIIIKHSEFPTPIGHSDHEKDVVECDKLIGPKRKRPFHPKSIVNISGMSFGSTGSKFTSSSNNGARLSGAFQDTGEGGFSPYHACGGDVIFQIGTGYFGCGYTNEFGDRIFSLKMLQDLVEKNPNIRAISIKLSQGAKAGHGGVLPGKKVTKEIAAIRGVEVGKTVFSPIHHSSFSDVSQLVDFIEKIAEATGLPVGIKSAVSGSEFWEDLASIMYRRYGSGPDFIQVDGGEGGTGSAPPAFADNISLPFFEAFPIVYTAFKKMNLHRDVFFIGSGKLGLPTKAMMAFAMGVDSISIAREVMMSAGCIQAMKCHKGNCPAGIATHSWWLQRGYDVQDKSERIARFIKTLRNDILHLCYANGCDHPSKISSESVMIRVGDKGFMTLKEIIGYEK